MRLVARLPRHWHFRSVRDRLVFQYASLFAVAMLGLLAALTWTTEQIASAAAERELASIGATYDRLWLERTHQFQQAAGLLAKDFGFRAAVATGDRQTAASALDNLRERLGLRTAFVIGAGGEVLAGTNPPTPDEAAPLWRAFDADRLAGVARLHGRPVQLVAAPILTPQPVGWIVFASELDQHQLAGLEALSAVPVQAGVVERAVGPGQPWRMVSGRFPGPDGAMGVRSLSQAADGQRVNWLDDAYVVLRPLPGIAGDRSGFEAALLLRYPHERAMAPFRPIQWAILTLTLVGFAVVVFATIRTAGHFTRPLARLDDAARRLAEGERCEVIVEGTDELARLSRRFNHMANEIEERETRIRHLAFSDPLTGLPNRTMFHEQAELMLAGCREAGGDLVMMCLDLDNFKAINDTMGHAAGDTLLCTVADRLHGLLPGRFVARLGGDEFVVLAVYPDGAAAAAGDAARIIAEIGRGLTIDGTDMVPGTSIGIAIAGVDGSDVGTLLRNADLALYRAKETARGTFCFYEQSLNDRAQARRMVEADLRSAIERGEFELHYQPLFDLRRSEPGDGRQSAIDPPICTFEALVRWRHPRRGLVSPLDFIPIAEETGLIVEIGAWVIQEACRQAVTWPAAVRVAVNVSSVQFHRPGLLETVVQALAASGLAPDRLEVEITESIFLDSSEETLRLLHRLRRLGVRIALDDFGTGYSSLSYLQSFPFDKLKIDRSFIQALAERPGAIAVIRAITDLATALGMETTAEGVEDAAQLEHLRSQGCTSVQGFLFSRPVPATEVFAMVGPAAGATRAA